MASLASIQIGLPATVGDPNSQDAMQRQWHTAFYKQPVLQPVTVTSLGIVGDGVADPKHHGGVDKAILAYSSDHYPYWRDKLNNPEVTHGAFGENFSIEGMKEDEVCIGDQLGTKDDWLDGLGVRPSTSSLTAIVTYDDWTNLVRRAAVQQGQPLNVTAIPAGRLLRIPCQGNWDTQHWEIQFDQPSWLKLPSPASFTTTRPSFETIEPCLKEAIQFADSKWGQTKVPNSVTSPAMQPWMQSITRLKDFHKAIICDDAMQLSSAVRKTWACVWPVVYRERNRLTGTCDINWIRTELEACFRTAPELTTWMFVFARLVCINQVDRGLGITGDYTDGE